MKLKLFLIVVLVLVGVWMGINLARDKPLFSNPFADKELRERASERASEVVEKSREAIERKLKVPEK
jgi:hypothetical protein